jgi:hypothetical protein
MALIPVQAVGTLGVIADATSHDLPNNAWTRSGNVRFIEGAVEKIKGHVAIFDPPTVVPYHVLPISTGTNRYWVYAGLAKMYVVTGTTHTNITRSSGGDYTASAGNNWTGTVMGGIAFLNNGVDTPQYWAGVPATPAANLTNWPANTTCRALRSFRNVLIAMDVTESGTRYPHMVRISHPADPGALPSSWDHTDPTKDAVRFNLADDQTRVIDGLTLGQQLIVYKEGAYYALQPVGRPEVFRPVKISGTAGALGRNCIAEFPGGHCVLGQGDVFVHSGGAPQSIIDKRMRRWLLNNIDSENFGNSFVVANPNKSEVWVCLVEPGQTLATRALIWNYRDNNFTTRDLPNLAHANTGVVDSLALTSWDSDSEPWDSDGDPWNVAEAAQNSALMVMASTDTKLFLSDTSHRFNQVNMTSYVERKGLSFGSPQSIKLIRGIRPRIEATAGTVNVYVGYHNTPAEEPTYTLAGAYDPTTGNPQIDCFVSGRYIALKFESTSFAPWRMYGFDVDVIEEGLY